MVVAVQFVAMSSGPGFLGDNVAAWVLIGVVSLVVFIAAMGAMWLMGRRGRVNEIRELVSGLEELRAGQAKRQIQIDPSSPLAVIADAVNRLGQDIGARWREAESSAERLRAVMDAARDTAIITTDTDGDLRTFSQGATVLFGWEEDEVLSRPSSLLFEENAYKDFLPKLARRTLRERGITDQATLLRKDGSTFPANLSVRMMQNVNRQAIGFLMVVKDITQQIRLESELRDSEKRYRALVEGLGEGVLIVRGGSVLYANPAFAELCGVTSDRLIETALRDRVATSDVLLVQERLAGVENGDVPADEFVARLVDEAGQALADVRIHATAVEYSGRSAVLLLAHDETLERRIQAELRQNESRLDAVLEATSDGIVVISDGPAGGVVQMTNRAFSDLLDLPLERVLGASESQLLQALRQRGQGAEAVAAYLAAATQRQQRQPISIGDDDSRRDLEVSAAPLRDRAGRLIGRVLACRDVTEQRASELKLQDYADRLQLSKTELEQAYGRVESLNRDLTGRSDELDRLNEELRKLDEMKSNLLGNVSHELQTPLVSIRGYTEMILKGRLGPISEEQHRGLKLSLTNIDRLIGMIDNLLAFSRGEPDQQSLRLSHFALAPLMGEAAELTAQERRAKGVHLDDDIAAGLSIHADRDKILQVFLNLLSNAVKYNKTNGRIHVAARPGEAMARITVQDSGVGIPQDQLGRIFDRHFQVELDRSDRPPGTGIGLAIVQDILRRHGCRIQVQSNVGVGTTFSFDLPLGNAEAGHPDERIAEPEPLDLPPLPEEPTVNDDAQEEEAPQRPRFRIIRRRDSG